MKVNGTEVTYNPQCPTCGHVHPNGMGLSMCSCDDCGLLYFHRPDLLPPEGVDRRKKLIRQIEEPDSANE